MVFSESFKYESSFNNIYAYVLCGNKYTSYIGVVSNSTYNNYIWVCEADLGLA